ncbi:FecR family protein [Pedobacter punctiformis]|uniref:FecR domain-containing protein n=1 Tax=Pedobacter punctiformis TaxID=3004097 RepID=A0ABT4LDN4_9SPHI|nr:FecR domain-containing protein [Pedobacter sp. HCMS5-2]MCZ4245283.1 FecR domain-containing protein [Pedobacter sp. HCMS5-2]
MDEKYTYINDDLLAKYLLDEASETERTAVDKWVNEHPLNLKYLEDLKTILEKSKLQPDQHIDEYEALERLNARLIKQNKGNSYLKILRIAAIITVVCGIGWFMYLNTIASNVNVHSTNQVLTKSLPDGSVAILNKESTLSYKGGFFKKIRDVNLKGEAFFKVEPDKSKPFIIKVNDVTVTVVGTSFNVKSINGETIVIVETGIVKVNNARDSVRLVAGERVKLQSNQQHLNKAFSKDKLYNYYYTNELVCDNTPLQELVPVLNEKFNANIVISNPEIKTLPISTTFKNESLNQILNVIAQTFKIKVVTRNGIIELK